MFRDSGIRIRGQVPEFALFLRDLVQNDSRTTVVDNLIQHLVQNTLNIRLICILVVIAEESFKNFPILHIHTVTYSKVKRRIITNRIKHI